MDPRIEVPTLEVLFHRLAVVNARLHETNDNQSQLLRERREIMELITRERLGNHPKRVVGMAEDAYTP